MNLMQAAQIIIDANRGAGGVPVMDFCKASEVVLDAMRAQITCQATVEWCKNYLGVNEQ